MRHLLLVRHAAVVVDPARPAAAWLLSADGRAACAALADVVRRFAPVAIVSSLEPKARDTAAALADALGVAWETAPDLHEHDRSGVPVMDATAWRHALRAALERPDDLVLGRETARAAAARFTRAVSAALAHHPAGDLVVVAHGTVISLLVAAHNDVDAFAFWERLGMPSLVVLEVPGLRLGDVVSVAP